MNIIIPTAGLGSRFKEDNYDKPKPLINVLGEPLIFHVLKNLKINADEDTIYIIYNQILDQYNFRYILLKEFPTLNIRFIVLNFLTRGAVETVLCALNKIQQEKDLINKTLVIDCDTFYEDNILEIVRKENNPAILYFDDESNESIFSYIVTDCDDHIIEIKEKIKISNKACVGAYFFNSGEVLKQYCEITLNEENKSKGEYYISNIYDLLLKNNVTVKAIKIENFHCLGTPQQLQTYCLHNDFRSDKKRFCFDLDNTLFTYPEEHNNYKTVKPIIKNIKLLKYLHKLGHTIIIHTARKMKSSNHNIGKATKNAYKDLFNTLEEHNIPFDEIYFGKPFADFYIDDLSAKPFEYLEKELGFYNGQIEPRSFNNITSDKNIIIKTTNNYGEIYWYKNIPHSLKEYFPKVYNITDDNKISLDKVNGILFSYLLVNNSLTTHNLDLLFNVVNKIHNTLFETLFDHNINIYHNYNKKIIDRYDNFDYNTIDDETVKYFNLITFKLNSYEINNLGQATIIHGDLVFSNIFLCDKQVIKFIDMRGKIDKIYTIYGDKFYDYAKIYQSLIGYDFILNDCEINYNYLNNLQKHFEKYFIENFGQDQFEYLKYITASLLFSLIPLHTDIKKQKKYFELIKGLI